MIAGKAALRAEGEIVEIGDRSQVFEDPRHPYTKKLMKSVPVADPAFRKMEADLMVDDIPSPLRPLGYEPGDRLLIEVREGHLVMPFNGMAT